MSSLFSGSVNNSLFSRINIRNTSLLFGKIDRCDKAGIERVLDDLKTKGPNAVRLAVSCRDPQGFTPLMKTVATCGASNSSRNATRREILDIFLRMPEVNVNACDEWGRTSLHLASQNNDIAAVESLLKAGAQPDLMDSDYFQPADYAGSTCMERTLRQPHTTNPPLKLPISRGHALDELLSRSKNKGMLLPEKNRSTSPVCRSALAGMEWQQEERNYATMKSNEAKQVAVDADIMANDYPNAIKTKLTPAPNPYTTGVISTALHYCEDLGSEMGEAGLEAAVHCNGAEKALLFGAEEKDALTQTQSPPSDEYDPYITYLPSPSILKNGLDEVLPLAHEEKLARELARAARVSYPPASLPESWLHLSGKDMTSEAADSLPGPSRDGIFHSHADLPANTLAKKVGAELQAGFDYHEPNNIGLYDGESFYNRYGTAKYGSQSSEHKQYEKQANLFSTVLSEKEISTRASKKTATPPPQLSSKLKATIEKGMRRITSLYSLDSYQRELASSLFAPHLGKSRTQIVTPLHEENERQTLNVQIPPQLHDSVGTAYSGSASPTLNADELSDNVSISESIMKNDMAWDVYSLRYPEDSYNSDDSDASPVEAVNLDAVEPGEVDSEWK